MMRTHEGWPGVYCPASAGFSFRAEDLVRRLEVHFVYRGICNSKDRNSGIILQVI
jgi:hypothetical protein